MSSESKRRRLKNLFKSDPHCFWCDCLVTLENRYNHKDKHHIGLPPNGATLDHIISRNDEDWKKGMKNGIVLSCNKCNHERQAEEIKKLPKEELWHRSGRYPQKNRTTELDKTNSPTLLDMK